jgi:hypothetical protein
MSTWQAIQSLTMVLSDLSVDVLPAGGASMARPATSGDLSAIVVSATEVKEDSAGVGGVVEAWPAKTPSSRAARCSGRLALELWGQDTAAVMALAAATFEALRPQSPALGQAGFLRLSVHSTGPIEQAPMGTGGSVTGSRMTVGVSFVHETTPVEDHGPHAPIASIDVELQGGLEEVFALGVPLTAQQRAENPHPQLHP